LAEERGDIRLDGFVRPFRAKLKQNQMPSLGFGAELAWALQLAAGDSLRQYADLNPDNPLGRTMMARWFARQFCCLGEAHGCSMGAEQAAKMTAKRPPARA
jgi:hypothetical protein